MSRTPVSRWLTLLTVLGSTLLVAPATAAPCGGKDQRACCVGERKGGACNKGLHEEPGCKGKCKCGNSLFESIGTCRKNKTSEPSDIPGLPPPRKASPCGGRGERACCIGEREGTSCDKGLSELPGCKGDCRCGGLGLADSSGTCGEIDIGAELISLTRMKELEKLFGDAKIQRLRSALSKTVLDPKNTPKWTGMSARVNAKLDSAVAIIAGPVELKAKVERDVGPYADDLARAGLLMAKIADDKGVREHIGTLLVAAAEGRFDDPKVQEAVKHLAKFGGKLIEAPRGARAAPTKLEAPKPGISKDAVDAIVEWLPKSFGVTIGWSAGAHVGIAGGFAGDFGFVADFDPTQKIYDIRAVYYIGEGVGVGGKAAAYDLGVAALYHLHPLPAKAAPGPSFGLVASGGTFATVDAEVQWGFVTRDAPRDDDVPRGGIKTPSGYSVLEPKPSVAIGAGLQLDPGAAVLFSLGWTATFGRPGTGGLCDASGCWDLGF